MQFTDFARLASRRCFGRARRQGDRQEIRGAGVQERGGQRSRSKKRS
jgi:hypothetical protein